MTTHRTGAAAAGIAAILAVSLGADSVTRALRDEVTAHIPDGATISTPAATSCGPPAETAPDTAPTAFPVEIAADGRYLVDQHGRPWRIQADAAWLMSSEASPEQVDAYLDTRRSQGFNSFYLMAAVHPGGYEAAAHAPNNVTGDPPFAEPGDFSTAGGSPESERYWAWIDSIVAKAAQRDMAVMLAYTYLGWSGEAQGWYSDVLAQRSIDVLHDWGTWLGNRYRDDPNVIWLALGDFAPPVGSEGSLRTRAIVEGIKDAGATQPFMAELNPPDEIPGENADFADVIDMNSFYGYGPGAIGTVYETARRAWDASPAKPAWMQEGTYEFENNYGHFSGETWDTRRGRFWSVLGGGSAGDGFGSRDVWQWRDIPASLDTPGAAQSTVAFQLFETLPWWDLRPSGGPEGAPPGVVLEGGGTWGGFDYVTAATTGDGAWVLAYVPNTATGERTLTIDTSALAGPAVLACWFDPVTGGYLEIGELGADTGPNDITSPGRRDDGTDDWLLVLRSAPAA